MERPEAAVVVGAAGLVGRRLLLRWKKKLVEAGSREKLISLDLREPKTGGADVNLRADLRDPAKIEEILFKQYNVKKLIIAIKPPLIGPPYQFFMEVNLAALCDLANLAQKYKVGTVVYVSSFACCNHWCSHLGEDENSPGANPPLSALRSPYDLSKQMVEQFILQKHSDTMRTVSVRIGGVYGDDDDQYWNRRLPFGFSFDFSGDATSLPKIDSNYAENVAEALAVVVERLAVDPAVGGRFYFYTNGDRHAIQQELSTKLAAATGRINFMVPIWILHVIIPVMSILSSIPLLLPSSPFKQPAGRTVEPKPYFTHFTMAKMGFYHQAYDNSLFRQTFGYSHAYTVEEAIAHIKETQLQRRNGRPPNYKRFSLMTGAVFILFGTMVARYFRG